MSSIFSDAGGYSWTGWRAPVAARYKLRVAGYTIWVAGGGVARWFFEGQVMAGKSANSRGSARGSPFAGSGTPPPGDRGRRGMTATLSRGIP